MHAHDPHAVSMAALALSFGAPTPRPKMIASRRVDFHLQSHAFSQWKYRQMDGFIAASHAIKAILVQDGIPAGRIDVVHDGIDVDKIAHRPATDLHAEYWLPHGVPVIVNVGALVGAQGAEAPDRRDAAGAARGAGRAPGHLRRRRAARCRSRSRSSS